MNESNTRLREAIRNLAPTHAQRAKKLGVSVRMVIWYLDGTHTPSLKVLRRVPELLSCLQEQEKDHQPAIQSAA